MYQRVLRLCLLVINMQYYFIYEISIKGETKQMLSHDGINELYDKIKDNTHLAVDLIKNTKFNHKVNYNGIWFIVNYDDYPDITRTLYNVKHIIGIKLIHRIIM